MTGSDGRSGDDPAIERLLAGLLRYGTWIASAVIALGLGLEVLDWADGTRSLPAVSPSSIVALGIALLILLPVLRVTLMLAAFAIGRDYRFVGISALVLLVIALGFLAGAASNLE